MNRISKLLLIVTACAICAAPAAAQELTGTLKKIKDTGVVKVGHLAPGAGLDDDDDDEQAGAEPEPVLAPHARRKPDEISEDEVVAALAGCDGNATHAAKKLGLYRTQLSRLRHKFGLVKKKS